MQRRCPYCGRSFRAKNWGKGRIQRWCSWNCYVSAQREKALSRRCDYCGKRFRLAKVGSNQRYCSEECRKAAAREKKSKMPDPIELKIDYILEGKSTRQIAKERGVHPFTVVRWLRRAGIPSRSTGEGQAMAKLSPARYHLLQDRKFLRQKHLQEKFTIRALAEILGVSYSTARKYLKLHGLATRHDPKEAFHRGLLIQSRGRRKAEVDEDRPPDLHRQFPQDA